jgi:beta-1,4-N-acetylglucosaminyltransferase
MLEIPLAFAATVVALVVVFFVLVLRTRMVLKSMHHQTQIQTPPKQRSKPIKTLVVLGSGGHTTEMLHLLQHLNPEYYTPLVYIVATTDTTSVQRVQAFVGRGGSSGSRAPDHIYKIPRSREVGQSYGSSIWTTMVSLVYALYLCLRIRPGLLLINGPGTCLPIALVTLLYRILGLCEGKIVFCESFCRVTRYVVSVLTVGYIY